eukprot:gnl/MRDRNA2_/MRDRNA2_57706_c0_seq1.p1 gnl/MRDRNA2_/MRDRNA2_57706_c0~~gnl/MRDRNA2_/MRDRNA2_57706_c0_seq1.p1  ORF type:complete len:397 (+),score=69.44 gnl/MRDRNA2_/MRDRNA2_57706_c0_seq1:99-1289(+)
MARSDHPEDSESAGELNADGLPINAGQPACEFYLKTGTCRFGTGCKWSHPPGTGGALANAMINQQASAGNLNSKGHPLNPGAKECEYYMKTGDCKFGASCKFSHPELKGGRGANKPKPTYREEQFDGQDGPLPINEGQQNCTYYMKTGTCKFGTTCVFAHPPGLGGLLGSTNEVGLPIRPGQQECPNFMKFGECKYGTACKYTHPSGIATAFGKAKKKAGSDDTRNTEEDDTQGPSGVLPSRPGMTPCPHFLKTGNCSYGWNCKFDHPGQQQAAQAVQTMGMMSGNSTSGKGGVLAAAMLPAFAQAMMSWSKDDQQDWQQQGPWSSTGKGTPQSGNQQGSWAATGKGMSQSGNGYQGPWASAGKGMSQSGDGNQGWPMSPAAMMGSMMGSMMGAWS